MTSIKRYGRIAPFLGALACSSTDGTIVSADDTTGVGVPVVAQAAMSILLSDDPACGAATTNANLGTPVPGGERVVDGQDMATVTCQVVRQASGAFFVSGSMSRQAGHALTVRLDAEIQPGGSAPASILSFIAPVDSLMSPSNTPCTVSLDPGSGFEVQPGAIFAGFQCISFTDPNSPGRLCQASGTFIFVNCVGL